MKRNWSAGLTWLLALLALTLAAPAQEDRSQPRAPFDAVVWVEGGDPEGAGAPRVLVDGQWYRLHAIDGIETGRLLAAAERTWGPSLVRKRFEEDLVELMGLLGATPGATVTLRVTDDDTGQTLELRGVEMTHERRQNLRRNARNRERTQEQFTAAETSEVLDALERTIERSSAYAAAGRAGLWRDELRQAKADLADGMSAAGLRRRLERVITAIGDGHASISGGDQPSQRWLPILLLPLDSQSAGPVAGIKLDRSGLAGGDKTPLVVSLDGKPIEGWIAEAARLVAQASPQLIRERACRGVRDIEALRPLVAPEAVGRRHVTVEFASMDGASRRTVTMPLAEERPLYGSWPIGRTRLLDGNIGYLRLASMDREAAEAVRRAKAAFADARGLIIDVRGNSGGSREALREVVQWLLDPPQGPLVFNAARPLLVDGRTPPEVASDLADRGLRTAADPAWTDAERAAIAAFAREFRPELEVPPERFAEWHYACISPSAGGPHFRGPVVVLMDAACFSATDVFLAAMKAIPGVTLIGQPSAGGSGAAQRHRLRHGFSVRLSSMVSFQPDGQLFDGRGVTPHRVIPPAPEDFIQGPDRLLDAAVEIIRAKTDP